MLPTVKPVPLDAASYMLPDAAEAGAAGVAGALVADAGAGAGAADLFPPPSLQADNIITASNAGRNRKALENTMLFSE